MRELCNQLGIERNPSMAITPKLTAKQREPTKKWKIPLAVYRLPTRQLGQVATNSRVHT